MAETFQNLPVPSALDFMEYTMAVAKYISRNASKFETYVKRNSESGDLSGIASLEKSVEVGLPDSLLRLAPQEQIVEDVQEHAYVYLNSKARQQGIDFIATFDAINLRRRNPKRAKGKLKKLFEQNLRSPKNRKIIKANARANAALLKDFNKTEVERLATLTSKSIKEGWSTKRLQKEIKNAIGITNRRAVNIARDQIMRLNSQMTEQLSKESGVKQFIWVHSGNPNGRPVHIKRNGKKYSFKRPPSELPGELNNCMCSMNPVW